MNGQSLTSPPTLSPLGDSAVLATTAGADRLPAWLAACDAEPAPGVTDVVLGFESLAAHFDPRVTDYAAVRSWLAERFDAAGVANPRPDRLVELPALYDGEDLALVAERARLTVDEVVRLHADAEYRVRVVGFAPGFPYLEGLAERLHTPRRATPRTRVPAGSVAIVGSYTGVYPDASPGGWNLIGRTPTRLFDATRAEPSLLRPGDRVRFTPVDAEEYERLAADARSEAPRSNPAPDDPVARVLRPGVQTTLQDLGRPGRQRLGVSPGGAMDAHSLRLANRLVGASEDAVAIEATLVGPVLEFLKPATIALVGAEAAGAPMGRPQRIDSGQRLDLTRLTGGARCYVAVAGGWRDDEPIAGQSLRTGDLLATGRSTVAVLDAPRDWAVAPDLVPRIDPASPTQLRVLRGPQADWFPRESWDALLERAHRVSPQSSRRGVRLAGGPIAAPEDRQLASQPVTFGAIQVPPDGGPIILGADRQTLGGYPVIACVASVDLPIVGQLSPGDEVRFEEIDLSTAERLFREGEARLRVAMEGIDLHG